MPLPLADPQLPPVLAGLLLPRSQSPQVCCDCLCVSRCPVVCELPKVSPEAHAPSALPGLGRRDTGGGTQHRLIPTPCHLPAGSQASESLLARARCYGFLGQKKTAMFDFNAVLRAEPENVQALCGRALVHLALDQLQVPPHSPPGPGQTGVGDPGSCLPLPQGEREPGGRPEQRDAHQNLCSHPHLYCSSWEPGPHKPSFWESCPFVLPASVCMDRRASLQKYYGSSPA